MTGNPRFPLGLTISAIANHFDIPVHSGRIYSLDMLLNLLESDRKVIVAVDSTEIRENLILFSEPEYDVEVVYEPLRGRSDFESDSDYNKYIAYQTGNALLDRSIFASDADYDRYI